MTMMILTSPRLCFLFGLLSFFCLPTLAAPAVCPDISQSATAHRQALLRAKELAQAMLLGGLTGSTLCQKELQKLQKIVITQHTEGINEEDALPRVIEIDRSNQKYLKVTESFDPGLTEAQKKQVRQQRFELNSYFFKWSYQHKKIAYQQELEIALNPKYSEPYRCGYTPTTIKEFVVFRDCVLKAK